VERDAERDERLRRLEHTPTPALNTVVTHQAVKAKDPKPYDGVDNRLAKEFLTSCRIVFLAHPDQFQSDMAKILYAGSFLTGTARTWFEPIVEDDGWEPNILREDWTLFTEKFSQIFSDPAEQDTAEQQLFDLRMRDDQHISEYMTKFSRLVSKLGWSEDSVLKAQFRRGLAPRLKDKMASKGKQPDNYEEMVEVSLSLDTAYWRREEERKRERSSGSARRTEERHSGNRNDQERGRYTESSRTTFRPRETTFRKTVVTNRFPSTASRGSSSGPTGLSNVLTRDGALKSSERQRRMDAGLCLYCSSPDHKIDACPRKPASTFQRSGAARGAHSGKA
jgi:hypothetical protein